MTQANKALARRSFDEIWNQRNLTVIDELYHSAYVGHIAASAEIIRGVTAYKQFVAVFQFAFPDTRFSVEDQLAEADRVASRWIASATQQQEIMGITPSRETVTLTGISIQRIAEGKIVESWDNWDALSMLQGGQADVFELLSIGA